MGTGVSRPTEDDATRGLTLRELVIRTESKVDLLGTQLTAHLMEHANRDGIAAGEKKVLGIAKSTLALIVSTVAGLVAIVTGLHVL